MEAQGGRVTFARFMELALTHPTDGYYSRTDTLLGPRGHFSTAPCLCPAFNLAVGRLLEELVDASLEAGGSPSGGVGGGGDIALVELGAGEGDLAKAALGEWQARRPDLRERVTYTIVEIGEHLQARQRKALAAAVERGWRVAWARAVDEACTGASTAVIVGNEFIDALPVHLVDVRGDEVLEAWVGLDGASAAAGSADAAGGAAAGATRVQVPQEVWQTPSPEVEAELRDVFGTSDLAALRSMSGDGIIELRPAAGVLLGQVAVGTPAACLLTIDYGEWFGSASGGGGSPSGGCGGSAPPAPYRRTLRGYFRHQLVEDPYLRPGRQDLTADVDFRALDLHGRRVGFETVLFTTVGSLLRADGGEQHLEALWREAGRSSATALETDRQATILEALLDDSGLGGAFKVMLQVRE